MGSEWIEVGSALMKRGCIVAVSEINHNKYDEVWNFLVQLSGNERGESVRISNKDESYVRKEHTALKNTLLNS